MSHGDTILELGPGYNTICKHRRRALRGLPREGKQVWGIQFHPEVWHSTEGPILLKNFVMGICGCTAPGPQTTLWSPPSGPSGQNRPRRPRHLGLSGGVDSTVAAGC